MTVAHGNENNNKLTGSFVECCDCFTICPCWVKKRPDEDHCSALYIWTFDPDAKIEGHDIGGKSVAAAAFYRSSGVKPKNVETTVKPEVPDSRLRVSIDPVQQNADNAPKASSGMQSAIYVDDRLPPEAQKALIKAFSSTIKSLQRLVGTVVDSGPAKITYEPGKGEYGEYKVTVEVDGSRIAHAIWTEEPIEGQEKALRLYYTALHDELGIVKESGTEVGEEGQKGPVRVQKVNRFEMAVSHLPGGPFVYAGRSGMAARFDYSNRIKK